MHMFGNIAFSQERWIYSVTGLGQNSARDIQRTSDGGYIIAGELETSSSFDFWVLKLDRMGNIIWQKTYGYDGGNNCERAYSIKETSDGGYIVAGSAEENCWGGWPAAFWIIKLNKDGSIIWQKKYKGDGATKAPSIQQTNDGGYIVAGMDNFTIIKIDGNGDTLWHRRYPGYFARSIQQTSDGGYIVAGGSTFVNGTWPTYQVYKLDAFGNIIWQRAYGGDNADSAESIMQTADGGYIIAGSTGSFGAGSTDVWVIKLNADGDISWQKTYGNYDQNEAYAIIQAHDEGYIVTGGTFIMKININGDVVWKKEIGNIPQLDSPYVISLSQAQDDGYVAAGAARLNGSGYYSLWVFKIDSNGKIDPPSYCDRNSNYISAPSTADALYSNYGDMSSPTYVTDTYVEPMDSAGEMYYICGCFMPSGLINNSAMDLELCADTGIVVTWNMDPGEWGDNGSGTRTYDVLRNGETIVEGLPYGMNSFADASGIEGMLYTYSVRYHNGCGLNQATSGAEAADNGHAPQGFQDIIASDLSQCLDTGINISWAIDPIDWGDGGFGTRTYDILREGEIIAGNISYGTSDWIDITGTNGIAYEYAVRYNNGCQLSANTPGVSAADNFDSTPCPDVANTLLVAKFSNNAIITWASSACLDLAYYRIFGSAYYGDPFPSVWDILGNPTTTVFNDPLNSYYIAYKVLSIDACGNLSAN